MNSKYREERHRPPFYLLTGIILGLIIGFAFSFYLFPIEYSNVPPETLQSVDKDQYRLMIAYAYHADQDIGRAKARLGLLREDNLEEILLNQAQRSDRRNDAQILLSLYDVLQESSTIEASNPQIPTQTKIPTLPGTVTYNNDTEYFRINYRYNPDRKDSHIKANPTCPDKNSLSNPNNCVGCYDSIPIS